MAPKIPLHTLHPAFMVKTNNATDKLESVQMPAGDRSNAEGGTKQFHPTSTELEDVLDLPETVATIRRITKEQTDEQRPALNRSDGERPITDRLSQETTADGTGDRMVICICANLEWSVISSWPAVNASPLSKHLFKSKSINKGTDQYR